MPINISIILPTYKCEFLEDAVKSVVKQSYKNWELIIIDNNLNNNLNIKSLIKQNKKIRYYKISNKGIIGKSRNFGIRKSKYDWIAFLDSDDYWYNNKLEEVVKKIKVTKYDFFYHNMHRYSKSNYIKRKIYKYSENSFQSKFDSLIMNGNDIIQSSVVLRKKLITKNGYISEKKNLVAWEDFDMWLKISKRNNKFLLIDKCLGKYFSSNDYKEKHTRFINNIKHFSKKYSKEIISIKKKYKVNDIAWITYAKAFENYNKGNFKKAKKFIDKIKSDNKNILLNLRFLSFKIFLKKLIN